MTPNKNEVQVISHSNLVDFGDALRLMEERVHAIIANEKPELLLLLEHPPIYTSGTSANSKDLINETFPVYQTKRGGKHTYHGPGQRICYIMLDLKKRKMPDLKKYVFLLEELIIRTLNDLGINGFRADGRVGVWVLCDGKEEKIASIGVRVKKWVTYFGVAINNNPNLNHFDGIIPCGIKDYGVASVYKMGVVSDNSKLDQIIIKNFKSIFKCE